MTAYEDLGGELVKAGVYLRGAVAAFVRDPVGGLGRFGWPEYDIDGELEEIMALEAMYANECCRTHAGECIWRELGWCELRGSGCV